MNHASKKFFLALLSGLMVGLLAAPALALGDADYRKMMKDPEFAAADKKLNQVWAGLRKSMPKDAFEALKKDQSAWSAKGRDEDANARMKRDGLSRTAAYAAATRERAEALPDLARRYAPPKPKAGEKETAAPQGTDARREAYLKAARAFVEEHKFPDGNTIEKEDIMEDFANNRLAICDVNGDGQPELLLFFDATHMAAKMGFVYGFDERAKKLALMLFGSPFFEFFDNGCVKEPVSHNHGLAGEFWPYGVSKYDPKTGKYEEKGGVDAWSEEEYPTDHFDNDKPFPKEIDKTGDGFVYYINDEDDKDGKRFGGGEAVDTPVYEEWAARYFGGANLVEPDWVSADVKGLRALEKK